MSMKDIFITLLVTVLSVSSVQAQTCEISGPTTVCTNQNETFHPNCDSGVESFYWMVNGSPQGTLDNPLTHSFTSPGAYVIEMYYSFSGGFYEGPAILNVVVSNSPQVPVIQSSATELCAAGSAIMTITNPEVGVTYTWSSSPIGFSGTGNPKTFNSINQTTTFYVVADNGACQKNASQTVTLVQTSALPAADVTMPYHQRTLRAASGATWTGHHFWQTDANGISEAHSLAADYVVTQGGNYYSRRKSYPGSCWTTASSQLNVTLSYVPPKAEIVQLKRDGFNEILFMNNDKTHVLAFADYYWVADSTSSNPAILEEFIINNIIKSNGRYVNGTYYLKGKDRGTGTWGATLVVKSTLKTDEGLNWIHTKAFDGSPDTLVVSESKSYFDDAGKPLQSQTKNLERNYVFATQSLRDKYDRVVSGTLPAPIAQKEFTYNSNFVQNTQGEKYSHEDFDGASTLYNPNAVGNASGTLGWYYSANNTIESNVPVTNYPYSRTEFYQDGTGEVKRSVSPGDQHRLGIGHEALTGTFPVFSELDDYILKRTTVLTGIVQDSSLRYEAVQTVMRDQNGKYVISIADKSGKGVMSARHATSLSDSALVVHNTVVSSADEMSPNYRRLTYFYILNPQPVGITMTGASSTTIYGGVLEKSSYNASQNIFKASTEIRLKPGFEVTGGNTLHASLTPPTEGWYIENIVTGEVLPPYQTFADSTGNWPVGFYRLVMLTGEVTLTYKHYFADISYQFYDDMGRLKSSVSPNGFVAWKTTAYYNIDKTTYDYNFRGWLLNMHEPDAGTTSYKYRKDGKIRFSQNALQRENEIAQNTSKGKFSYTNYDQLGRPIESGQYIGAQYPTWQIALGIVNQGDQLVSSNAAWANRAASTEVLQGDGWVEMTVPEIVNLKWLSLDASQNPGYANFDFAIYMYQGSFRVYENGSQLSHLTTTLSAGNKIRIERVNGVILYKKNGQTIYTSSIPSTGDLFANIQAYGPGAVFSNVVASFSPGLTFSSLGSVLEHSNQVEIAASKKNDWVKTYYDFADSAFYDSTSLPVIYVQEFTRGAVSRTENANVKTWYSYDELGRVTWMAQKPTALSRVFVSAYDYDFLGNVLTAASLSYESGEVVEEFYHRYQYDKDKRLVRTFTGSDSTSSKLRATYEYYLHGPLKRVELGGNLLDSVTTVNEVQGIDYVYNINGWLTHINHPNQNDDPGGDSNDAFGMVLDYYQSDITDLFSDSATAQYNGMIAASRWRTNKPYGTEGSNLTGMYSYTYDDKYQIQEANWLTPNHTLNTFSSAGNKYRLSNMSYDPNGNILSLKRYNDVGSVTNNFSYTYKANKNQLEDVTGYTSNSNPRGHGFTYNAIGQMTHEDLLSGDDQYVQYDVTGKVTKVFSDASFTTLKVEYVYDDRGFRLAKKNMETDRTTWYVRDAGGNILSVYESTNDSTALTPIEVPVYGSARIGTYYAAQDGSMAYELTDHLGNVRALVRDNITVYTATMEDNEEVDITNPRVQEMEYFQNIFETEVNDANMNHTPDDATIIQSPSKAAYLYWVSGMTGIEAADKSVGPAIALKVNEGDTIKGEAWVRYENKVSYTRNFGLVALSAFLGTSYSNVGGFEGMTSTQTGSSFEGGLTSAGFMSDGSDNTRPFAYINYMIFNNSNVYVAGGWQRISEDGGFDPGDEGLPNQHVKVQFTNPVVIPPAADGGYIYVWVSNESEGTKVWFDDVKVTHTKVIVTQATDYETWGGVLREMKTDESFYRFGYQGQFAEKDEETGWDHFELRDYDPVIGKWTAVDPYGQHWSPYIGIGNNPINSIDPDGGVDWYKNESTGNTEWHDKDPGKGFTWIGDKNYVFGNLWLPEFALSSKRHWTSAWFSDVNSSKYNPYIYTQDEIIAGLKVEVAILAVVFGGAALIEAAPVISSTTSIVAEEAVLMYEEANIISLKLRAAINIGLSTYTRKGAAYLATVLNPLLSKSNLGRQVHQSLEKVGKKANVNIEKVGKDLYNTYRNYNRLDPD